MGYTPELSAAVWVGYPDAGVAMPGAQGGTYAAPVWNAFMTPAHGEFCGAFPQPTEPFVASPFFGEYASTGGADTGSYDYDSGGSYTEDPDYNTDTDDSGDTSTGGGQYDPNLYEAPPQQPPDIQAPPEPAPAPTPAPETGGTGGTGADG